MVVLFGLHWDKRGHTINRNVGRKWTDKSLEKLKLKNKEDRQRGNICWRNKKVKWKNISERQFVYFSRNCMVHKRDKRQFANIIGAHARMLAYSSACSSALLCHCISLFPEYILCVILLIRMKYEIRFSF